MNITNQFLNCFIMLFCFRFILAGVTFFNEAGKHYTAAVLWHGVWLYYDAMSPTELVPFEQSEIKGRHTTAIYLKE